MYVMIRKNRKKNCEVLNDSPKMSRGNSAKPLLLLVKKMGRFLQHRGHAQYY